MSYKGHIFNTPIGVMVGVGDDEPFTHIIHKSIFKRQIEGKGMSWYICIPFDKGKKIVFNNTVTFRNYPPSDVVYPLEISLWIKVRVTDTSPITIEDIKTQLKF